MTSGLVTVPSVVASGETVSIPAGRTLVHPNLQVDGTLQIDGTLFIPSGGSVSTTEVDATVVKQNGNVVANDSMVVHKTDDETIAGVKTFSSSPIVPVPTLADQAISMGNIIEKTGVGLGYGAGSGGTVTQLTSKSTAVTLNKPTGKIIMNNSALSAGAIVSFVLNNSLIGPSDTIITNIGTFTSSANDTYTVRSRTGYGACVIVVSNTLGSSLSENVVINFAIIKGATE